jgi:hypothetical protein
LDADDLSSTALQRLQQLPSMLDQGPEGAAPGSGAVYAGGGLVMTDSARQLLALVAPWLRDSEPFLLVNPYIWLRSGALFAAWCLRTGTNGGCS